MHEQGREFDEIYDLTAVRVHHQLGARLLRRARGRALAVEARARPLQGLHRDAQGQHVPVAAHDGHRAQGRSGGDPDPHATTCTGSPRRASPRTGSTRRRRRGKDASTTRFVWLRQLLESQQETNDPAEFLDSVRVDLFPDEVYVFTPKGDVKALPEGSTPIDFAYAVHTEVGDHCVGAKVNGKLVPLRYTLRQGDIVEIVTSPNQHPSRDWLKIVKSHRARVEDQPVAQDRGARPLDRARPRDVRARGQEVPAGPRGAAGRRRDEEAGGRARLRRRPTICWPRSATARPASHQLLGQAGRRRALLEPHERRPRPGRRPARAHGGTAVRIRGRGRPAGALRQVLQPVAGRRHRGVHHARPRPDRARPRLPDGGQERARPASGSSAWSGTSSEPAKRPVRIAVYIGRDRPGLLAEITGAISSRARQHHQGRGHGHRRPARGSTTSWSRSRTCASCRTSCRPSARSRTSSTSSGSAASSARP